MNPSELLLFAADAFQKLGIDYAVVGSVASSYYGEARFTHDIDIVANITLSDVPQLTKAFPADDFYLSPKAAADAIRQRSMFNIIHPDSGLKLDIMIPASADSPQLRRKRQVNPSGGDAVASFAAPEEVILKKLEFYQEGGSEKHLRDIAGMLRVSGSEIDQNYVTREATLLGLEQIWAELSRRTGI